MFTAEVEVRAEIDFFFSTLTSASAPSENV
jgi:hypothetical protein